MPREWLAVEPGEGAVAKAFPKPLRGLIACKNSAGRGASGKGKRASTPTPKKGTEFGNAKTIAQAEDHARKLGLEFASFRGLDLGVANLTVAGLADLKRMGFPLPKTVTTMRMKGPMENALATMDTRGNYTVNLKAPSNSSVGGVAAIRQQMFQSGHFSSAHLHATTFHEVGHHLHRLKVGPMKYASARLAGDVAPTQATSRYGQKSQTEAVAEGFAKLASGKKLHRLHWHAYKEFGGFRPRDRRRSFSQ